MYAWSKPDDVLGHCCNLITFCSCNSVFSFLVQAIRERAEEDAHDQMVDQKRKHAAALSAHSVGSAVPSSGRLLDDYGDGEDDGSGEEDEDEDEDLDNAFLQLGHGHDSQRGGHGGSGGFDDLEGEGEDYGLGLKDYYEDEFGDFTAGPRPRHDSNNAAGAGAGAGVGAESGGRGKRSEKGRSGPGSGRRRRAPGSSASVASGSDGGGGGGGGGMALQGCTGTGRASPAELSRSAGLSQLGDRSRHLLEQILGPVAASLPPKARCRATRPRLPAPPPAAAEAGGTAAGSGAAAAAAAASGGATGPGFAAAAGATSPSGEGATQLSNVLSPGEVRPGAATDAAASSGGGARAGGSSSSSSAVGASGLDLASPAGAGSAAAGAGTGAAIGSSNGAALAAGSSSGADAGSAAAGSSAAAAIASGKLGGGGNAGADGDADADGDVPSDIVYVPVPGAPGGFSVPYDPDALPEAPFTLQRLSEVLLDPDAFGNAHKLMNSLEKVCCQHCLNVCASAARQVCRVCWLGDPSLSLSGPTPHPRPCPAPLHIRHCFPLPPSPSSSAAPLPAAAGGADDVPAAALVATPRAPAAPALHRPLRHLLRLVHGGAGRAAGPRRRPLRGPHACSHVDHCVQQRGNYPPR